jgi:hypothetical protein
MEGAAEIEKNSRDHVYFSICTLMTGDDCRLGREARGSGGARVRSWEEMSLDYMSDSGCPIVKPIWS